MHSEPLILVPGALHDSVWASSGNLPPYIASVPRRHGFARAMPSHLAEPRRASIAAIPWGGGWHGGHGARAGTRYPTALPTPAITAPVAWREREKAAACGCAIAQATACWHATDGLAAYGHGRGERKPRTRSTQ